jgi:hypothetical protein
MTIQCPNCQSEDSVRTSILYAEGLSDLDAQTRGIGIAFARPGPVLSFGRARTTGTVQSRLSKQASPPRKKRYRYIVIAWILGLLIGEILLSYVGMLTRTPESRFEQQLTYLAWACSGLAVVIFWIFWTFNRKVLPRLYRRWERSFICGRCGNVIHENTQEQST